MKKLLTLSLMLFAAFTAGAQGINFETGTWKEVVAKAKKEKKPIYMDVYTTWCGPCKMMSAKIFPEKEAGDKYNALFINYKIDAEKGEGLEIAKKYKVSGYPTNLYIDPKTEEVVYRVMGATMKVDAFNKRADIAIAEAKDPMKWEEYQAKLEKGKNDKKFLESYLEKANRLDKNNDAALDIYIKQNVTGKPDDKTLNYLLDNTKTYDNTAVALLENHKESIDKLHPELENYFYNWTRGLSNGTLLKAITQKDEKLLDKINTGLQMYDKADAASSIFWYRKEFYAKTGNAAKAWQTSLEEADYLVKLPATDYTKRDEKATIEAKKSLLFQIKAMGIPEDQYESTLQATFDQNPSYLRSASVMSAQTLNSTAWEVYENKQTDKPLVTEALKWSEKSLKLTEGLNDLWPSFADTYAHLLFINGDKAKAIALQEEAVKKAEGTEDQANLKDTLEKMKTGKL